MQVGVSAGPECKVVLQEITQLVEQKLASQGNSVKALFGASEVCLYFYFILVIVLIHAKRYSDAIGCFFPARN